LTKVKMLGSGYRKKELVWLGGRLQALRLRKRRPERPLYSHDQRAMR